MTYRTSAHVPGRRHQPIDVCCLAFGSAMQGGTDNEGYGPLIYLISDSMKWAMGVNLPQPAYCPWCGALTEIKEPKP